MPGQIDVWRIVLAASNDVLWQDYAVLDDYERTRAAGFLDEHDRRQYIFAHGHMRKILAFYLGMPASEIKIIQRRGEKPFIANSTLLFSLSHTAGFALLAVSNTGEVGIDIEYKRDNIKIELTAKSTFSDSERQAILSVDGEARRDRFFNCWTRKEAFIKAIGKGFSYDTKSFSVTVESDQPSQILCFERGDFDVRAWTLLSFTPCPNTQAALAFAFLLTTINFLEMSQCISRSLA